MISDISQNNLRGVQSPNTTQKADKSKAEQEFIDIIKNLQAEQPKNGRHGELGVPYTMPSSSSESIQERTAKLESIFSDSMKAIMEERGISSDPSFELTTGTDGHVYVKGDHPQKAEIEQMFQDNQELENLFRGISGNHAMIDAFDRHMKFSEEYAINQVAAVMKYASLFDNTEEKSVSMRMDENGNISWSVKDIYSFSA